jgi:Periplasmic binding protein
VRARIAGLWPMAARQERGAKAKLTPRRKLGIGLAVAVVLAGAGLGLAEFVNYRADADATCMNQGITIVTHQGRAGDCVGLTDGSYQFDPASKALAQVENAIKREDAWVRSRGSSYVSVAYLMPVSATGGVEPITTVAEQLQGAYTAQHYANRNNVEGTAPLIQLLIASSGLNANEYPATVHEIENYVTSQHLVAVAGIGVSLRTTIDEVKELAGAGIPVFGASITSDAFDNIKNMVRSSPSNQESVNAALSFIKKTKGSSTAFLIEDVNPSDSYDTTIVNEFRNDYPKHLILATEIYNAANVTSPSGQPALEVANRIGQMTSDICSTNAGVVLFAGRGRELATLVTDLGTRNCLNHHVTIVTGPDVTDMPFTTGVAQGLSSGVTLYYVGEANPAEWNTGTGPAIRFGRAGFLRFSGAFSQLFPHVPDNDSNAMMGYDGTLTSIYAIRLAGVHPSPGGVIDELSALQNTRVVQGASGPISLPANYLTGQGSNPVGKPVPVLELTPKKIINFVQLEWPTGIPVISSAG